MDGDGWWWMTIEDDDGRWMMMDDDDGWWWRMMMMDDESQKNYISASCPGAYGGLLGVGQGRALQKFDNSKITREIFVQKSFQIASESRNIFRPVENLVNCKKWCKKTEMMVHHNRY